MTGKAAKTVRRSVTGVVATATALLAVACTQLPGDDDQVPDQPSGQVGGTGTAPAASSSPVPVPVPAPGEPGSSRGQREPLDDLHDHPTPSPESGAGRDAAAAARLVVSTWSRPGLSAEQWWTELEPLLSVSAREAYGYTDPSVIPALQVTSAARAVAALSAGRTFAVVDVRTSLGVVRVNLTRTTPRSGWVMDRMDLSEVLGRPAQLEQPAQPDQPDQPGPSAAAEPARQG